MPSSSTAAWVEEKREPSRARWLALAAAALVAVLGLGGAALFFGFVGLTAADSGVLEVSSSPEGAQISLDNEPTGLITPHQFKDLRLDHTYQVKLSYDGYRHELREVKLTAEHPRETVSLELRPSAKGIITVKTSPPGATVYFNGRPLEETTPTTIAEVTPLEEQAVLVKLENFNDRSESVIVEPGKVVELDLELEAAPLGPDEAFLAIESTPEGARIALDDKLLDQRTPVKLRRAAGERVTVEVNKMGFRSYQKRVTLKASETTTVRAKLDRSRDTGGGHGGGSGGDEQVTGTGLLYFNAIPYCDVTIGGRSYGATPLVGVELPAGRHLIRCSSPPIGVTKMVPVTIPPNGTVRRQVKLTP